MWYIILLIPLFYFFWSVKLWSKFKNVCKNTFVFSYDLLFFFINDTFQLGLFPRICHSSNPFFQQDILRKLIDSILTDTLSDFLNLLFSFTILSGISMYQKNTKIGLRVSAALMKAASKTQIAHFNPISLCRWVNVHCCSQHTIVERVSAWVAAVKCYRWKSETTAQVCNFYETVEVLPDVHSITLNYQSLWTKIGMESVYDVREYTYELLIMASKLSRTRYSRSSTQELLNATSWCEPRDVQ